MIIPAYNERENAPLIVPTMLMQDAHFDVLVVHDNPPEGTVPLAHELAEGESRVCRLQCQAASPRWS